MKIISPIKDYYDYVGHIYGEDTDGRCVVYNRGLIPVGDYKTAHFYEYGGESSFIINHDNNHLVFPRNDKYHYRFLVVVGKQYLCVKKKVSIWESKTVETQSWQLFDPKKHIDILSDTSSFTSLWRNNSSSGKEASYYLGSMHQNLIDISKELQQPVFSIDSFTYHGQIYINRQIPRLADYHFGSIVSAEQLYQEIEYFIGNTLKDNPDIVPPVNVSNKDLIVAKGFDLKQSFRKRKKSA